MDRLWHVLKLLKHGKIKLVCESLDEPCVICPFVGRNIRHFRLSFPGVDRGPCWKPSSRQSSELGALSATHGQRHPSALYKNVKYPKVLFQIFRTQKSTSIFFLIFVFFFPTIFPCHQTSDIRCAVDIGPFLRRALRSCPAPPCWLSAWKSRPNSWALRWSNCRSFKSLLPKIFR